MLIYFIVMFIPLFFGIIYSGGIRFGRFALNIYFWILVIFTGLRDGVGCDWLAYVINFERDIKIDLSDSFNNFEPGNVILNHISNNLGLSIYGVNFFCAFIFLYGLFAFAKKTTNPWLSISVVTPYLIFIISMSGIRQAVAMGVGFLIFANWKSISIYQKILFILFACFFHSSAIILFIFVVVEMKSRFLVKLLLAAIVSSLVFTMVEISTIYNKFNTLYIESNIESTGAFFHVLLSAFPAALYFLFHKRILVAGMASPIVKIGAYMSICALPMVMVSSTGISRLSLYFSFVQMWIYPALIYTFNKSQGVWIALTVGVVLSIYFVYFVFGTNVFCYMPYKNVLFDFGGF